MKLILLSLCVFIICLPTRGLQLPFGRNFYFDSSYSSTQKIVEEPDILAPGSPEIFNSSEFRNENGNPQPLLSVEDSLLTNQNSSESTTDGESSSNSPDATTSILLSTVVLGKESQSQNLSQPVSRVTHDDSISNATSNVTVSSPSNESDEDEGEQEGVVRGKPPTTENTITTLQPQSLYQKTWALISDTYTLSVLVPVAAGVVFATTILLTIAFCRCLRRCCVRGRLMRKKVLPDSVKNLRPSDRARLLAESSDDEF